MAVSDPVLPAAVHLSGPPSRAVLGAAVEAAGGRLGRARTREVHYRPRRELVVGYDVTVSWPGRGETAELLFAAATTTGAPPGTLPLAAAGLEVGVWRYPFDPALPGLAAAVSPAAVAELLGVALPGLELEVVALRPCRRAVVRACWPAGVAYLKVVPPTDASPLAHRHATLLAAGLPVPEARAVQPELGIVILAELPGDDLRHRLESGSEAVPRASDLWSLVGRLAELSLPSATAVVSLVEASRHQAELLAGAVPSLRPRLADLVDRLEEHRVAPWTGTVHGDLHDGQLKLDPTGRIMGLLDLDGVGVGDVLDDLGRFLGHLVALAQVVPTRRAAVLAYADRLLLELAAHVDPAELAHRTAAALVGLASGPWRTQHRAWRQDVDELLTVAERLAMTGPTSPRLATGEGTLRPAS